VAARSACSLADTAAFPQQRTSRLPHSLEPIEAACSRKKAQKAQKE
jgi:hypothetical protein